MEGRVLRRSVTLADQLATVGPPAAAPPGQPGSCNLRDLLKLRDEDDGRRAAAVTLASAMQADRRASSSPPSSSAAVAAAAARTLLDIIRDDQPAPPASHAVVSATGVGDPFVRRAVSLPAPGPALTRPVAAPVTPPEASPPQPPTDQAAEEEEEQGERVSLMALLEQTERQWSAGATAQQEQEQDPAVAASEPSSQDALVPEDDAELPEPGRGAGCCCVCMARAKGAAFIPCGHTFCRACARELLAGRGRCPLCNAAILDVLDIF
ncbi:formin-like protein 13 [Triticum urartu]|uniref:formin-like protein 13 n=1 Tax=Triticum urartu TaxID=4572 RepID=UPI0020443C2B|nr:formin-like protein 13 [Triticum urartu]